MDFFEEAKKKLEGNAAPGNVRAQAMAPEVRKALLSFCEQDGEFAQAVAQGGSFAQCMSEVAKGVGSSISDLEAYRKAVRFYFPGAEIRMTMSIDLIGAAELPAPEKKTGIVLNLEDFL